MTAWWCLCVGPGGSTVINVAEAHPTAQAPPRPCTGLKLAQAAQPEPGRLAQPRAVVAVVAHGQRALQHRSKQLAAAQLPLSQAVGLQRQPRVRQLHRRLELEQQGAQPGAQARHLHAGQGASWHDCRALPASTSPAASTARTAPIWQQVSFCRLRSQPRTRSPAPRMLPAAPPPAPAASRRAPPPPCPPPARRRADSCPASAPRPRWARTAAPPPRPRRTQRRRGPAPPPRRAPAARARAGAPCGCRCRWRASSPAPPATSCALAAGKRRPGLQGGGRGISSFPSAVRGRAGTRGAGWLGSWAAAGRPAEKPHSATMHQEAALLHAAGLRTAQPTRQAPLPAYHRQAPCAAPLGTGPPPAAGPAGRRLAGGCSRRCHPRGCQAGGPRTASASSRPVPARRRPKSVGAAARAARRQPLSSRVVAAGAAACPQKAGAAGAGQLYRGGEVVGAARGPCPRLQCRQ